jgi:Protein of unknown function (DUF3551)
VENIGGNFEQAGGTPMADVIDTGIGIRCRNNVEMTMKSLIPVAALAVAAFVHPGPASAQEARVYPWCAGETAPAEECIFDSFDQCRQTVRGVGGFCYMNPSLQEPRAQFNPAYPVPRPDRRHR